MGLYEVLLAVGVGVKAGVLDCSLREGAGACVVTVTVGTGTEGEDGVVKVAT